MILRPVSLEGIYLQLRKLSLPAPSTFYVFFSPTGERGELVQAASPIPEPQPASVSLLDASGVGQEGATEALLVGIVAIISVKRFRVCKLRLVIINTI